MMNKTKTTTVGMAKKIARVGRSPTKKEAGVMSKSRNRNTKRIKTKIIVLKH